ncbi:hypothetical protein D3C71_1805290 [compost metagenome]
MDVLSQCATHACQHEDRQAQVQRPLAPPHIGQGAKQRLAYSQCQKEGGEAGLYGANRGIQARANLWQRGQIHIDGKGPDGREQTQNEDQAKRDGGRG